MEGSINKQINKTASLRGFTLVEVLILLVTVSILISGAFALFFNVISFNKAGEYQSIAYKILDSKLESIREQAFDSIASADFNIPALPEGRGSLVVSNEIDGLPQSEIKQIDVTVSWHFKKTNQARTVTYVTKGVLGQ